MNVPSAKRWIAFAALACGGAVTAWAVAPEATFTVPDTIAARVLACAACHGQEGRATSSGFFPRIAGKPAGYLYSQLLNFRDGRRSSALMAPMVANLSDAYLREMADYFAGVDLPYPAPQALPPTPALRQRGETLVREGEAARGVPACVSCHGAAMTGIEPGVPGLLGLPRDYLTAQLGAWRTGQRRAVAPDCMRAIAEKLNPEDVNAVAGWLAAQPVPVPAKAQPAGTPEAAKPAMECGGVPR